MNSPNKDPNGIPNAAEFGLLNAFLASQMSYTPEQRKAAVGSKVDGRTRDTITDDWMKWRKAPK